MGEHVDKLSQSERAGQITKELLQRIDGARDRKREVELLIIQDAIISVRTVQALRELEDAGMLSRDEFKSARASHFLDVVGRRVKVGGDTGDYIDVFQKMEIVAQQQDVRKATTGLELCNTRVTNALIKIGSELRR